MAMFPVAGAVLMMRSGLMVVFSHVPRLGMLAVRACDLETGEVNPRLSWVRLEEVAA